MSQYIITKRVMKLMIVFFDDLEWSWMIWSEVGMDVGGWCFGFIKMWCYLYFKRESNGEIPINWFTILKKYTFGIATQR